MKFQILDKEGNPETFEKQPPEILERPTLREITGAKLNLKTDNIPETSIREFMIKVRESAIEQCAQIADQEARISLNPADTCAYQRYDTGIKIGRQIRALLTCPQPESPRNITQEQAVIAALVEACKNLIEQFQTYRNGWMGVDKWQDRIGLPDDIKLAQDALALADTLKKGGFSDEKE